MWAIVALLCGAVALSPLRPNAFFEWRTCAPMEVHLGVTEDPTTMRITWRTQMPNCQTNVRYVHAGDDMENAREVYGVSYVGDSEMLCGSVAGEFDFKLHLHTAVLTGLTPNEDYDYALPHDGRRFTFTASKPAGDDSPFVFFVFGDMGVTIGNGHKENGAEIVQSAMLEEIRNGVPDLMLDVGDISYANGDPRIWEAFMSVIEPFASQFLWVAGIGNHEYDMSDDGQLDPWGLPPFQPEWGNMEEGDSEGECGLHVYWRFPVGEFYTPMKLRSHQEHLPAPPFGAPFPPFYYSFNQGLVHFVTLSTEHDVEPGSAQMTWLENDLTSVDRCKTPFVVATGHRPFYAPISDKKDYRTGHGLRDRLEEILIQHRVDVYISGHVHVYYRLCEARNWECVPPGEGLVSMVIGSGGHEVDDVDRDDFNFDDMVFVPNWGFGKFLVDGHRSLEFSFIEAETGEILDSHKFLNQGLCKSPPI